MRKKEYDKIFIISTYFTYIYMQNFFYNLSENNAEWCQAL